MDICGPELSNAQAVASHLEGVDWKVVELLMQNLMVEENKLLEEYYNDKVVPINSDPFPKKFHYSWFKRLRSTFFGIGKSGISEFSRSSK